MGIFSKIKDALKKTKETLGGAIKALFTRNKIGDEFYEELEEILISADIAVTTAEETVEDLRAEAKKEKRLVFQSSPQVASVLGQGYQRQWLFIDGDNIEHVQVARAFMKEKTDTRRVILVSGSVEQTQKALQKRVWFDQAGVLIQKLHIESLPAFVEMTSMGVTVTERPASFFLKDEN